MDELEGWEWGRDSVGARRFGSAIDNTDVDAGRATAAACAGDIKSDPVPDSNVNEGPRTAPIKTAAPLSAAVATNRGSVGGKRLSKSHHSEHILTAFTLGCNTCNMLTIAHKSKDPHRYPPPFMCADVRFLHTRTPDTSKAHRM